MSSYVTQPASEKAPVLDGIEPTAAAGTFNTGYIDASQACNFLVICMAGTVGTSVDCKITQSTDNAGAGEKDVTGKAITQLTAVGSAMIELSQSDLDTANDFNHIRVELVTVGATTVASVSLQALDARYEPLANGAIIDEVV